MAYNKGGCKEGKKMGKGGCKVGKKGGRKLAKEAKIRMAKRKIEPVKPQIKKRPAIKMTNIKPAFRYYNTMKLF